MYFKVSYKESARRDLEKILPRWQQKIVTAIETLKSNPFQTKKLHGKFEGLYSLRIWPYRIIYKIEKKDITIVVLHIGHRQGIYN